jgi:hypothetical protein
MFGAEPAIQIIPEEENPEYGKHNEKLDQYDDPKLTAPGHCFKAFIIE